MAGCATQTFTGITIERFGCLLAKAQEAGINIVGNSGSATQDGITIDWNFSPAEQTLDLQCTSAPFYVPCGTINSKIHDLVDECP
jgi:hypothetical protein